MNKNAYVFIVIAVIVISLLVIWQYKSRDNVTEQSANVSPESPPKTNETTEGAEERIITYTDSGFSPNPLTIKNGETVTFKNESSKETWPASAMHPTHTVYPGSDIKKCGSAESGSIFDACSGVKTSGRWSFVFGVKGTWKYHDHLTPNKFGAIVVE